jgi:hypothetical protein
MKEHSRGACPGDARRRIRHTTARTPRRRGWVNKEDVDLVITTQMDGMGGEELLKASMGLPQLP